VKTCYKGQIAELKVALRAAQKGFITSKPLIDARYDYVIDDGNQLFRTQVKYADGKSSKSSGAVVIRLRGHRNDAYNAKEVDLLLVYIPKLDAIVYFKPEEFCKQNGVGSPSRAVQKQPKNQNMAGRRSPVVIFQQRVA
jgi:hypothetical protein